MPTDSRPDETDGNPDTEYEDTTAHERTGFGIDPPDDENQDNGQTEEPLT